jgi:hypothetical protein
MTAFTDYTLNKRSTSTDSVGDLYTLSAPRTVSLEGLSSGLSESFSIGFDFSFNDTLYRTIEVSPHGWARIYGDDSFTDTAPASLYTQHDNVLMAVWWQQQQTVSGIKTDLLGSRTKYKRVIQWDNYASSSHTRDNHDRIVYQLVLHQDPNKIEYRYGHTITTTGSPDRAGYGAAVGIKVDTTSTTTDKNKDFFSGGGVTNLNTIGAVTPDWPGSVSNTGGMPSGATQYYFRLGSPSGSGVPVVLVDERQNRYDAIHIAHVLDYI